VIISNPDPVVNIQRLRTADRAMIIIVLPRLPDRVTIHRVLPAEEVSALHRAVAEVVEVLLLLQAGVLHQVVVLAAEAEVVVLQEAQEAALLVADADNSSNIKNKKNDHPNFRCGSSTVCAFRWYEGQSSK
jgi:hypothetical protein